MKDFLREEYVRYKKYILIYLVVVTAIASMCALSNVNSVVRGSNEKDSENTRDVINTTLMDNLETYAGVYSVSISNAVNPTATLAVLSVLGTIENYDEYFGENPTLDKMSNFLSDIPFLRTADRLPIANPYAAGILVFLTVAIYVMRSFKASKAVSQATIDKLENVYGFVVSILLAILPITMATVVAATTTVAHSTVSPGTFVVTAIIGIMAAIFSGIMFICINMTIDSLELLATIAPIPHANQVMTLLRFILHSLLIVLQIFSPVLSVIVSFIIMIAGFALFKYAYLFTTYYGAVYGKAITDKIFNKGKIHPLVDSKCPRRIKKKFAQASIIVPAFSFNKINGLNKRTKYWFIVIGEEVYVVYCRFLKKMRVFSIDNINANGENLYIHKDIRFIRVLTPSKRVDFAISNIYSNQIDAIRDITGYRDYQGVIDANPNSMDKKLKKLMFWKKDKKKANM